MRLGTYSSRLQPRTEPVGLQASVHRQWEIHSPLPAVLNVRGALSMTNEPQVHDGPSVSVKAMQMQVFRMSGKVRVRGTPDAYHGRESCHWPNQFSLNWLAAIDPITN